MYFDSVFWKLGQQMWQSGLGLWLPASLPSNIQISANWLKPFLDQHGLMVVLSHGTIVFEALFLFLFWFDRLRPLLIIVGITLHVGVLIVFPIPLFSLTMMAVYLLLVPEHWYAALFRQSDLADTQPTPARTDGLLIAKLATLGFAVTLQATLILKTPLLGLANDPAYWGNSQAASAFEKLAHAFVGVCSHAVFVDAHFDGYDRIVAVTYLDPEGGETWLPLTNERGRPGPFARGRLWVKWIFRVNGTDVNLNSLILDLRHITAFWARREGIDLDNAQFRVLVKKFDPVEGWSPGFLESQVNHPWLEAGHVFWKEKQFTTALNDIEAM